MRADSWSGSVLRRVTPSLAPAAAAVTLLYCLFLFSGHWRLFRDSDTGWHIRAGERILAARSLPAADPFSFSKPGAPWVAWEWASDVLMAVAHRAGGLSGVALLFGLLIGASVWLWVQLTWKVEGDFLLAALLAIPFLSTANLHWMARPHVVSWLFLLAALWWLEDAGRRPLRVRDAALALLFTGAWANLHGSFFLGAGCALVYAVSHALRPLLWHFSRAAEWRKAGGYLGLALASAGGWLLTPYGWRLPGHVARYLSDRELLARIGEFQSFNFHAEGAGQVLLCLGVAAAGGVLALGQQRPAHFLLIAVLCGFALRSARGLPLVALLALPLANRALRQALAEAQRLRPAVRVALAEALAYSGRLRALDRTARGGWLAWSVAILIAAGLLATPGMRARTGFPPEEFPVEAAAVTARLPHEARLLAPDKFGGYLIYRFAGQRKVYFDGRSDFYGADFLREYGRLVQVRPGWEGILARYGFTHALLPRNYSLVAALEAAGWRRLHADRTAVLLAAPEKR